MDAAHVDFLHYRVCLTEEPLSRLGSRYFSRKESGKRLRHWVLGEVGKPLAKYSLDFEATQLACANEVFPEAALADPIADMEVWDEWRTGHRRFPHPGIYSRLEILRQEKKTVATSSVGVLGEVFAGLFSQAFVAPLVIVRPTRRWPDFILLGKDDRYSFVESKASAALGTSVPVGLASVRDELLGEGLADAVQELNAEPWLRVWLVFTTIKSVQPLCTNVCVLEIETSAHHRNGREPFVPAAVINGLVERRLVASAADLEPRFPTLFDSMPEKAEKELRKDLWSQLNPESSVDVTPVEWAVNADESSQARI
jgi:hypothetical protein